MHTSELFWRQNIDKFEEKDFQVGTRVCGVWGGGVEGRRGSGPWRGGVLRTQPVASRAASSLPLPSSPNNRADTNSDPLNTSPAQQVLRVLLKLLEASREVRTLAVACNDLGRFIETHPHGRYIVSDLRGKELVMRLMSHPDPEVQKRALLTVQKIMIAPDKLGFLGVA